MKILLGEFTGRRVERIQTRGWGRMWMAVDRRIYTYPGEPWGFDNAAFRYFRAGTPFDGESYLSRLFAKATRHAELAGAPTLAVVPDIVAGGERSLIFSRLWVDTCRGELRRTWPWFLAVQDGMNPTQVRRHLSEYDGLFLGGSDAFKATAAMWCQLAHDEGKRFHYGRAGTAAKLERAYAIGADSLDSALPMWTEARWTKFEQLIDGLEADESRRAAA